MEGWEMIFHANSNQKKAAMMIPLSDKVDFNGTTVIRDKEVH